jgi:hypothetical protein
MLTAEIAHVKGGGSPHKGMPSKTAAPAPKAPTPKAPTPKAPTPEKAKTPKDDNLQDVKRRVTRIIEKKEAIVAKAQEFYTKMMSVKDRFTAYINKFTVGGMIDYGGLHKIINDAKLGFEILRHGSSKRAPAKDFLLDIRLYLNRKKKAYDDLDAEESRLKKKYGLEGFKEYQFEWRRINGL